MVVSCSGGDEPGGTGEADGSTPDAADDGTVPQDGGGAVDATIDHSTDAKDDAADATKPWDGGDTGTTTDASIDARLVDASEDASSDGGDDAAGGDGGTDAGEPVDASFDAGSDAGHVNTDMYDPNLIPKFELGIDPAGIAVFQSTLVADQKKWVHGTFKYGATTLADVGLRRKGSSTFRALPGKVALKVKFDKYVPGQRFEGLTDLTLNNMVSDPTFLTERLAYHVFRSQGLPAQKANTARVFINDEDFGIYANIETPNEDLLARLFGASASTLYEAQYGGDWMPGQELGFDVQVGDGMRTDLSALFVSVQNAQPATLLPDVSGHLDTMRFLTYAATEATVGAYDGYAYGIWGSHNYFLAGDQGGVFSQLPWSTDLTFSDRAGVVNAANPLPAGGGPTLLGRCKNDAACWASYKSTMQTVLAKYEALDLVNLANTWHAQIEPLALADPKREASTAYHTSETTLLYGWIAARPGVVRAQLGLP